MAPEDQSPMALKRTVASSVGQPAGPGAAGAAASGTYAGDLSPSAAWDMLAKVPRALLVDCRSQAEWAFVGVPDLSSLGKTAVLVPWQTWPGMAPNAAFAEQLAAAGVGAVDSVIFLCRSGGRSRAAAIAMTARGFARCYNLAGGFEGPHDAAQHRGSVAGWKAAGLPWTQE